MADYELSLGYHSASPQTIPAEGTQGSSPPTDYLMFGMPDHSDQLLLSQRGDTFKTRKLHHEEVEYSRSTRATTTTSSSNPTSIRPATRTNKADQRLIHKSGIVKKQNRRQHHSASYQMERWLSEPVPRRHFAHFRSARSDDKAIQLSLKGLSSYLSHLDIGLGHEDEHVSPEDLVKFVGSWHTDKDTGSESHVSSKSNQEDEDYVMCSQASEEIFEFEMESEGSQKDVLLTQVGQAGNGGEARSGA